MKRLSPRVVLKSGRQSLRALRGAAGQSHAAPGATTGGKGETPTARRLRSGVVRRNGPSP